MIHFWDIPTYKVPIKRYKIYDSLWDIPTYKVPIKHFKIYDSLLGHSNL